jgi:predicted CoA-binding protein
MKVAILGASPKPERYSHQAQLLLMKHGHEVFPVNPTGREILGVAGLNSVPKGMDTVTLYLGPDRLMPVLDSLIEATPRRVIFNPGTECPEAKEKLGAAGIETEEACTLVLLRTGSF